MFKRTIIKLSGEAIGSKTTATGYNDAVIDSIVAQIAAVRQGGVQVALIVGGGNLWRGIQARKDMDRVRADQMGMLATVINAVYLSEAFLRAGQRACIFTPQPFANITRVFEKDVALAQMNDAVVIFAAGTGHPYFSTDTVTALRAAELGADCVLYAKNIDGVYDADPAKFPNAKKYAELSYKTAIAQDLKAADIAALNLAKEEGIPSYVFALNHENSIIKACGYPNTGDLQGTYISENEKEFFYAS